VAAHEVQASSRDWTSPPVAPVNAAAPAFSTSWFSGEATLVVSSGTFYSSTAVKGSSGA
jgi:hypothetical protein